MSLPISGMIAMAAPEEPRTSNNNNAKNAIKASTNAKNAIEAIADSALPRKASEHAFLSPQTIVNSPAILF